MKKVSDELKTGKNALKKVEDNNVTLAKSIRDLQDQLNSEKNKSSRTEVEKKRLERNSDRLEEIIEIKEVREDKREKTPGKEVKEEKCRFFEEHGWCKFGKGCHNVHPSKYCEWYMKVGRCPIDDCMELHSQKECPFWGRGFCKNENCRMKHDPKLKGNFQKRGRSKSPNFSPVDKRSRTLKNDDKKSDVHYSDTIEQRFNKQEEQNHFLAKSLAGISAELKTLSSQQPQHSIHPTGSQEQSWSQAAQNQIPRQPQLSMAYPTGQNTTQFSSGPFPSAQNTAPYPTLPPQTNPPFFNPYQ